MISLEDIIGAASDLRGRGAAFQRVPRTELVSLYNDGRSIPQIAAETGLHVSTVRHHLVQAGVYQLDPDFRHRHQQKETCKRGHDLSMHGRPRKGRPETTRECIACVRERDRAYKARKYAEKKEAGK